MNRPLSDYRVGELLTTSKAAQFLAKRDNQPCSQQAVLVWCQRGIMGIKDESGEIGQPGQWWIPRAQLEEFKRPKRGPRFKKDRGTDS